MTNVLSVQQAAQADLQKQMRRAAEDTPAEQRRLERQQVGFQQLSSIDYVMLVIQHLCLLCCVFSRIAFTSWSILLAIVSWWSLSIRGCCVLCCC